MAEHDIAARPCSLPQEQPEMSGAGAASWGTCEELLLVSAVKRHGVNNWNLISSELKARAITLNVNALYFSEAVSGNYLLAQMSLKVRSGWITRVAFCIDSVRIVGWRGSYLWLFCFRLYSSYLLAGLINKFAVTLSLEIFRQQKNVA